jgi:hypothetical protein
MITVFTCNAEGCPNEGIAYRMEETGLTAMCGGCKETLTGTPEQEEENNG